MRWDDHSKEKKQLFPQHKTFQTRPLYSGVWWTLGSHPQTNNENCVKNVEGNTHDGSMGLLYLPTFG